MGKIYESIGKLLKGKEDFVLATILEKAGSAPRSKGAKMIVRRDSSILGSIGGGVMEALVIKSALRVFEGELPIIEEFTLSNKEAASLGMICGGDVKVLLEYIDSSHGATIDIFNRLIDLQKEAKDLALITSVKSKNAPEKWIYSGGKIYGREDEAIIDITKRLKDKIKDIKIEELSIGGSTYIVEGIRNYKKLYIIGAGHVGQEISRIMKILDFYVVVMDDREEFANRDRLTSADEIIVLPSFDNILDHFKITSQDYVIIVTRGHAFDKEVLAQVLTSEAKYIGMIGSRRKKKIIYQQLISQGFTEEELAQVYCPIGLSINADTPEEIAVSIAGEIIQIKNEEANNE